MEMETYGKKNMILKLVGQIERMFNVKSGWKLAGFSAAESIENELVNLDG